VIYFPISIFFIIFAKIKNNDYGYITYRIDNVSYGILDNRPYHNNTVFSYNDAVEHAHACDIRVAYDNVLADIRPYAFDKAVHAKHQYQ